MKRDIKILVTALIIFLLSGCSMIEQKEDIVIVYTNDVECELSGEIGYAGVKAYKDYLKSENKYVSLVDAGDFFDGEAAQKSGGKYIVQIMNAVGYDVVTLGNQEFSIGLEELADCINDSDFDYVTCNLKYIGKGNDPLRKVKPYVIKKYGWTKVAFIGVITPETDTPGKPSYNAISEDGELIYSFYADDDPQDFYNQVQKTIDKVRKKVDYVIVLAHLGSNGSREGYSSYDLIENTSGIDVVIDGHSHTEVSGEPVLNMAGDMVALTSTGHKLDNVGVLFLHPDHTVTTGLYPTVENKDPEIEALVSSIESSLAE